MSNSFLSLLLLVKGAIQALPCTVLRKLFSSPDASTALPKPDVVDTPDSTAPLKWFVSTASRAPDSRTLSLRNQRRSARVVRTCAWPLYAGKALEPEYAGYPFTQARALVLIDSTVGLVGVLSVAMGMCQVALGVPTVRPGQKIEKGQFGGSDVVMLFEEGAQIDVALEVGATCDFGGEMGRRGVEL